MSSRRAIATVAAALLGIATAALPAHAEQLVPSTDPVVTGPLVLQSNECGRERAEGANGRTAAIAKACIRFYKLDESDENDATQDYGVIWLQTSVDARKGWCVYSATSDILIPQDTSFQAQVPPGVTKFGSRREMTVHLDVAAGGQIANPASIEQTFIAYPNALRAIEREEGAVQRLKWKGHTRKPLAFATGVEIAWDPLVGPPNLTQYHFDYDLGQAERCNAPRL